MFRQLPLIRALNRLNLFGFLFFLSFVLWVIAFRGFLSAKLNLSSDAIPYYEHFYYFIDNISQGVYPLWEPTRDNGAPVEFFLRRIGSYNPAYLFIVILYKLGLPLYNSYIFFLAFYYFLGLAGFYLVAKLIFRDRFIAFTAYLLLMFSSLGTRIFDSYMHLTFVPLVWFFYFLLAFGMSQRRQYFLGVTLAAMVLFSTYLPFYFITIFLTFLICYAGLYFSFFKNTLAGLWRFAKLNKSFVVICGFCFILSVLPTALMFKDISSGDLILPARQGVSKLSPQEMESVAEKYNKEGPAEGQLRGELPPSLVVPEQVTSEWGIEEDLAFTKEYYSDLKEFRFAVIYVPIFAIVLLFSGLPAVLSRKFIFLFLWGYLMYLISSPAGTPIYQFLYGHIFYYKYFRNLHFFLWLIILPVFILFLTEQLRLLLQFTPQNIKQKWGLWAFLAVVHAGLLWYQFSEGEPLVSTYLALALSLLFFSLYFLAALRDKKEWLSVLILIVIAAQPLEVYFYLSQNADKLEALDAYRYRWNRHYLRYHMALPLKEDAPTGHLTAEAFLERIGAESFLDRRPSQLYMGMRWVDYLNSNIHPAVMAQYLRSIFIAYDNIEPIDKNNIDLENIAKSFAVNRNTAFVFRDEFSQEGGFPGGSSASPEAQYIARDSNEFKVLAYEANYVKVKTNFPAKKFLVYNDAYHDGWKAFVNGRQVKIWRANVAFKGLWVPAGENIVYFRYGAWWRYVLNWALMAVFQAVFFCLIIFGLTKNQTR